MIDLDWAQDLGRVLLLGAAVAIYAASKAAVDALARRAVTGVRFGIGQWIPVAAVVIVATLMNQPELAVGVVFASCVTGLSLVIGFTILNAPVDVDTPANRAGWSFVLPAALLAFLAGLKGHLSLSHAGMLFFQGLVILPLWLNRRDDADLPVGEPSGEAGDPAPRTARWDGLQLVLAIVVCVLAGWAATTGVVHVAGKTRLFTTGLLALSVVTPILLLPAIGNGMFLSGRGQSWVALEGGVVMTLLNLCLLLPVTIVLHYGRQIWVTGGTVAGTTIPATLPTRTFLLGDPLPYPITVWRLDTIALIVLGVMLLPVATRRWSLGKVEGLALVLGYAIYLLWGTMLGIR